MNCEFDLFLQFAYKSGFAEIVGGQMPKVYSLVHYY